MLEARSAGPNTVLTDDELLALPPLAAEIVEVDRELAEWRAEPLVHITWGPTIRALRARKRELVAHAAKTFGTDTREHD